jgi:hypothetical protein
MNSHPVPPAAADQTNVSRLWWSAFFLLGVILTAATSHSLWIDECVTAEFARHPSLFDTWRDVVQSRFAEVQMPFYMTYMWAFTHLFGHSELALRLSALPFFLAGMTLLIQASARRSGSLWPMALAIGLSPFAWYYLNEARLYAMQLGITAMIVAALLRLSEPASPAGRTASRWLGLYLAGVVLLSALSMLGEIWAGAALLAVFAVVPRERWLGWWRKQRAKLLSAGAALLLLGLYYLWSLTIGARATAVGTTNLQTILFIFYEQLGFTGPGPGRVQLRESGFLALKPFLAGLALYAALVGTVLLAGLRQLGRTLERKKLIALACCVALPASFILVAGVATHFRALGRHFAPLAVLLLLILATGLLRLWQQRGWLGTGLAVAFLLASLWSCLLIRFAPRHEKDDCRQAATLAKTALMGGETVWWNAGDLAAAYYAMPLTTNSGVVTGSALLVAGPSPGFASRFPKPDVVIASKPDIYDAQGALAAFLKANAYQPVTNFMAFTIWHRPGEQK